MENDKTYYLVGRDTKGKIRTAEITYSLIQDEETGERWFEIYRYTGQLHGKITEQPTKYVERGKATRSLWDQIELETNHLVKEKLDKGYKLLEKDPEDYSDEELNEILGGAPKNQQGVCKPMLAKQSEKVTNMKIFDKEWYASRKIDGLRALIYLGEDGNLHSASRGAMNYDTGLFEILNHPDLIKLFEDYPDLILDGECYRHGYSLQTLNSYARTMKVAKDMEFLQFYWYDIVDLTKSFEERLEFMNSIKDRLNLTFDPNREFKSDELRIQFVPQEKVSGWDNMIKLHNSFVEEGWEGLVIRDPDKVYKPNGRSNDMIKIKKYRDATFLVIGYELGLRGSEDMVFICQMDDGKIFKAKPLGDREQKEEYVNNFESLYKNHRGDCKFFYLSDDGTPLQPCFKSFRPDLE